jgi:hypothetical protein
MHRFRPFTDLVVGNGLRLLSRLSLPLHLIGLFLPVSAHKRQHLANLLILPGTPTATTSEGVKLIRVTNRVDETRRISLILYV